MFLTTSRMQWMNPRPVYRWKSFWLGVLVLGLLGWAWVRSWSQWELVTWVTRSRGELAAMQGWGQLGMAKEINWGGGPGLRSERIAIHDVTELFPPWYERGEGVLDGGSYKVAHWFVMLVFLVVWGTLLGWRWRWWRMKGRCEVM